ncbi:MAG: hypothetical protein IT453_13525 [Planctomycetes bacterium]|nr:hypothetical protein [Planctomycetota bacterium]
MTLRPRARIALGGASLALLGGTLWLGRHRSAPDWTAGAGALPGAANAALDELGKRLGLQFRIEASPSTGGDVRFEAAHPDDVARFAFWLADEWSDYPRCWIETARLEAVVFCSELRWDVQPRASIPVFDAGLLYFDVALGAEQESYVRRVVHHEFFHSFDRFDDGELWTDEHWSALNPRGFTYGGGGVTRQHEPSTSLLETATTGFVDDYATSGVEEDKAELFAVLMCSPDAIRPRLAGDPYLLAKWRRLLELVATPCGGDAAPLPSP